MPEIISRSWPSRYLATSQPLFSSWTRWLLGTFTLSKKVSQNGELPEISRIGLVETPSLAMSNRTKLIPPCFDSLEVRTRQKIDRKSVVLGQSGSERVDLGGRRIIKTKTANKPKSKSLKYKNPK